LCEAGATVNLNDYYIQVNGTLVSRGSSSDQIHFNGGRITFTSVSNSWNEQTGSGCIIENAILGAITLSNASPKINNNIIRGNIVGEGSPIISNNTISGYISDDSFHSVESGSPIIINNNITGGCIAQEGGSPVISKNIISGITSYDEFNRPTQQSLEIAVSGNNNARVSDNIISGCSVNILVGGGTPTIERNLITQGGHGIKIDSGAKPLIQNNTITKNAVGIICASSDLSTIIYNNIYDNYREEYGKLDNNFDIYLDSGAINDINAAYNWWGTTDTAAISQKIYDFDDDFNLGTVTFTPFLTAPNPEAPVATSVPTSSPPPTTSPSTTPTPSQEPQQTEQLEAIIGAAIVATVFGAGLGLLIYLIKRK